MGPNPHASQQMRSGAAGLWESYGNKHPRLRKTYHPGQFESEQALMGLIPANLANREIVVMDNTKIEAEVKAGIEAEMVVFCKRKGIMKGWSVAQHAAFQLGLVMDVVESGLEVEETKFRIYVILRTLANYSAWRQSHEGPGKPLEAGTGRGTKSLAGEYGMVD